MAETALKKYQELEPVNRKHKRKLLKTQGWVYSVHLDEWIYSTSLGTVREDWVVYKIFKDGVCTIHDKASNHDTTGK